MNDEEREFVRRVKQRNERKGIDCFSPRYQVPIKLADGTLSVIKGKVGTALCGNPTFQLPDGATPLVCYELLIAKDLFIEGHPTPEGPSWACPHCLQLRVRKGQTVWLWVDGEPWQPLEF